jgi:hypothetical protein
MANSLGRSDQEQELFDEWGDAFDAMLAAADELSSARRTHSLDPQQLTVAQRRVDELVASCHTAEAAYRQSLAAP